MDDGSFEGITVINDVGCINEGALLGNNVVGHAVGAEDGLVVGVEVRAEVDLDGVIVGVEDGMVVVGLDGKMVGAEDGLVRATYGCSVKEGAMLNDAKLGCSVKDPFGASEGAILDGTKLCCSVKDPLGAFEGEMLDEITLG